MPDLPTVTVTSGQATRILAAYGDAANYKTWLKRAVRDYVIRSEQEVIMLQAKADAEALVDDVSGYLGVDRAFVLADQMTVTDEVFPMIEGA